MKLRSESFQLIAEGSMAACLGVMATAVFINVVLRYGFGGGIAACEELSRLLFVWMVFIAATLAYSRGELMAFTMLSSALQRRPRMFALLSAIIRLLEILACVLLAWGAWQQVVVGLGSHSVVMKYPTALLPLPALLCATSIGIMTLFELVRAKPILTGPADREEVT